MRRGYASGSKKIFPRNLGTLKYANGFKTDQVEKYIV